MTPLTLNDIFAVGRELILDQDAAAGSERQPLDVIVLRGVRGHVEDGLRRRRHIANRQTADLSRSRQIRLHQRRRQRQRPRDVVEPVRRIVGRQELRGVHFEREHVANRIRIFGAVEAVQARRRQMGGRAAIEFILHPGDQRLAGGRVRAAYPVGGIMPARSLRTTFSPISAWSPRCARSS